MAPISIIAETECFIAVSKPAGVCFHTETDAEGYTRLGFVEQVRAFFGTEDLFPVHRLDRVTSGLMVFAKGRESNQCLSKLFQDKQVKKEYLALSHKKPKKKQGLVSGDMTKARGGSYKLLRSFDNPAVTRFKANKLESNGLWFFQLWPETGKTHQLRVMCKSIGAPILGDQRYGGDAADRCYLHSHTLEFVLDDTPYTLVDDTVDFTK